jgi:hypothetical protein
VRRERAKQRRAEWFAEQGDRCKWCRSTEWCIADKDDWSDWDS